MTRGRIPRILVVLFFIALLATPLALNRFFAWRESRTVNADQLEALTRWGGRLEEVSRTSGINFIHSAPTLDPKLNHIMSQVASMGAGVSIVDFDRDGWADIYVPNSGEGSLN